MSPNISLSEIGNFFQNLSSWKEESQQQLSQLVETYNQIIIKAVTELVEENSDLRDKYSVTKKEKDCLLEAVSNLNGEIRHLNAKLHAAQPHTQSEEDIVHHLNEEVELSSDDKQEARDENVPMSIKEEALADFEYDCVPEDKSKFSNKEGTDGHSDENVNDIPCYQDLKLKVSHMHRQKKT